MICGFIWKANGSWSVFIIPEKDLSFFFYHFDVGIGTHFCFCNDFRDLSGGGGVGGVKGESWL